MHAFNLCFSIVHHTKLYWTVLCSLNDCYKLLYGNTVLVNHFFFPESMHWTVIGWSQRSSVFYVKSKKKQVGVLTFLSYKPWTMDGITTLCIHTKHGAGRRHLCFLNTNWCKKQTNKKKPYWSFVYVQLVCCMYWMRKGGGHSSPPQAHLPLCVCHRLALEYWEGQLCSSSVIFFFIRLNRNVSQVSIRYRNTFFFIFVLHVCCDPK